MSSPPFLLVALPGAEIARKTGYSSRVSSYLFSDALVIVGVGVGLLIILAAGVNFWMHFARKRRRHVSGGEKVYRGGHAGGNIEEQEEQEEEEEAADDDDASDSNGDHRHHHDRRRYKYRVRRRTHRSRNPTLSETGGLPPVKTPEPGKPL